MQRAGGAVRWKGHFPRPKPGTSERPPYRAGDPLEGIKGKVRGGLTLIRRAPPTAPSPWSYTTNPVSPLLQKVEMYPRLGALPPFSRPGAVAARKTKASAADPYAPETKLSQPQIVRLRKLRTQDPGRFTRSVLAKMFGVTEAFVGSAAPLKPSVRRRELAKRDELHEMNREKWSQRHQMVVEMRKRRKALW
ncbi:hypothetical protein CYLTODRAFT_419302 [Cylindrobasidium torrendii FP15055 ss-10]|uniref:Uncharacterized protein n=1 Tax=Cylindrobasidium torrendii FP15055 ss-10 TaxID=1314674 RepID=A0A0D7BL86_9AGAR|nr:hypothetical protein CYLTODRAFT_419302 [Cylindrobasidium torrendii FP15055 ss-10]